MVVRQRLPACGENLPKSHPPLSQYPTYQSSHCICRKRPSLLSIQIQVSCYPDSISLHNQHKQFPLEVPLPRFRIAVEDGGFWRRRRTCRAAVISEARRIRCTSRASGRIGHYFVFTPNLAVSPCSNLVLHFGVTSVSNLRSPDKAPHSAGHARILQQLSIATRRGQGSGYV